MQVQQPISIAICTYNRCEELRLTLAHLATWSGELLEGDEIIVIDNNSTDSTAEVVQEFESALPLVYQFEAIQGLSAARNAAIRNYRNNILLFIDDDITVTRQTLSAYRRAFAEFAEDDFFGGRIEVDWNEQRPAWLKSDAMPLISGLIGHYQLAEDAASYDDQSLLPYGANFAVSRRLVDRVGGFDMALGVKGAGIARGEETDYLQRAMMAGYSGRYLHQALVLHRFQSERLSSRYLYRYGIEKGSAQGSRRSYQRAATLAFKAVWQLAKGRVDRYYQTVINIGIAMVRNDDE